MFSFKNESSEDLIWTEMRYDTCMDIANELSRTSFRIKLDPLIGEIKNMKDDLDKSDPNYKERLSMLGYNLEAIVNLTKASNDPNKLKLMDSLDSYIAQANKNAPVQKRKVIVTVAIIIITVSLAVAVSPYLAVLAGVFLLGQMICELMLQDKNSFSEKQRDLSKSMMEYAGEIKSANQQKHKDNRLFSPATKSSANTMKDYAVITPQVSAKG